MKGTDGFSVAAGLVLTVLGVILLVVSIFVWVLVVYAIASLVLGIIILLTLRQQEHIEPIKKKRKLKVSNKKK